MYIYLEPSHAEGLNGLIFYYETWCGDASVGLVVT